MIEPLQSLAIGASFGVTAEGFQRREVGGAGAPLDRLGQLKRRAPGTRRLGAGGLDLQRRQNERGDED